MRFALLSALFPLVAGCVRTSVAPDLGLCAGTPASGRADYGAIPIGTCLAGPVDLGFFSRDGRAQLAISNADPFINFAGGSLLVIDWDELVGQLDRRDLKMHELQAEAVETEHFVGGFGVLADRGLALLTRRLSEGARTRSAEDSAWVLDLDRMEPWASGDRIRLKDDPHAVAVDSQDRLWVLNLTDHSVSLVDGTSTPLVPIDLAPEASITPLPFFDADGSGSVAELDRLELLEPRLTPDDTWTVEYLPGAARVWAETDGGLTSWTYGGGPWVRSPFGDIVTGGGIVSTIDDPVAGFSLLDESSLVGSTLLFASGGGIHRALSGSTGTAFEVDPFPLLGPGSGWDASRSGPSRTIAGGVLSLYYAGASAGAPLTHAIGVATSEDGASWRARAEPLLVPPTGWSYEQPFAQIDVRTSTLRMWLSVHDGVRYHVAHAESDDGSSWSEPEIVASAPFRSLAAPAVRWVDGQYILWAARDDGDRWTHVRATSADGLSWSEFETLFESESFYDARKPPRLAVQAEQSLGWRITGHDNGPLSLPVVAGARFVDASHGYSISVVSGHALSNDTFSGGLAGRGVFPTSHVDRGGIDRLYVTTLGDDGVQRIALLEGINDAWAVRAENLVPRGQGGNVGGASHAVVREIGDRHVMFYSAHRGDGVTRVRAATSDDGITWTPRGDAPILPDLGEWAGAAQEARTLELLDGGGARLWLAGSNGSRYRIGAVVTDAFDPAAPHLSTWVLDPGEFSDYQLGSGLPGGVDDSGVKDPVVIRAEDGSASMIFSAFDGLIWHLAQADLIDGQWVRRIQPVTEVTLPAMSPVPRSFSAGGVQHPVLRQRAGASTLWYSGIDIALTGVERLGRARVVGRSIFPVQNAPTVGDTLGFTTERGDEVVSVIELAQDIEAFRTTGIGTTDLILDEGRGFIYVPSKLSNMLYVLDIRDDSRVGWTDRNALDIESLVRVPTVGAQNGFRGAALDPIRQRLYLTMRNPDAVVVIDTSRIADDDRKEITEVPPVATFPMQSVFQDQGAPTVALISGSHPAIAGDLLLVPHFRDNSVSVFDLDAGAHGAEVAYIPHVGENPHRIAVSPDGRWAVVANYLGDVDGEDFASSTLALIDLDPASPDYLRVAHWIRNR